VMVEVEPPRIRGRRLGTQLRSLENRSPAIGHQSRDHLPAGTLRFRSHGW
jgi:hypothetical protein